MNAWFERFKFDGRRLILRNFSFQFFSIVMPAGFYLLFTKVMVTGNVPDSFNVKYMGSMIVYSGTINALFGIAAFLQRDREAGVLQWCWLSPAGIRPYYLSIGCWSLLMNMLSVVVLGGIAIGVNGVSLSVAQWGAIAGIAILGQLSTMLLGVLMSFVERTETLSVLSNLITFPMAIISGLWWPIALLPNWLQPIGKLMPTYFINDWLGRVATHGTMVPADIFGTGAWMISLLLVVIISVRLLLKRSDGVVRA